MAVSAPPDPGYRVEALVAAACRLAGPRQEARSVRIVAPRRPTYDELRRYQEWALDADVHLTVDGRGLILIRPCGEGTQASVPGMTSRKDEVSRKSKVVRSESKRAQSPTASR